MTQKQIIQDFTVLANSRNHRLIDVENKITPSQGKLFLHCNQCGQDFSTSAKSYKNARKTGCPNCKAIKARAQTARPAPIKFQLSAEERAELKRQGKRRKAIERREKGKAFQFFNHELLIDYFQKENNIYSKFMLDKIQNETFLTTNTPKENLVRHHMIPIHFGGPDSKWNLVYLTREDHVKAHIYRYQAYHQFGDYNFLRTQGVIGTLVEQNPEFEAQAYKNARKGDPRRRAEKSGIYAPGISQKGGLISGRLPRSQQQIQTAKLQMGPKVRKAFEQGSRWLHTPTGIEISFKPGEIQIFTDLLCRFIQVLPETDKSRICLVNTKKRVNVTSNLSKIIKGTRGSAYGWTLLEIFELK